MRVTLKILGQMAVESLSGPSQGSLQPICRIYASFLGSKTMLFGVYFAQNFSLDSAFSKKQELNLVQRNDVFFLVGKVVTASSGDLLFPFGEEEVPIGAAAEKAVVLDDGVAPRAPALPVMPT